MRKEIGPIASPDQIQFAPSLPKTRSGKIMRRILRKIAEDEPGSLGTSYGVGVSIFNFLARCWSNCHPQEKLCR